jgi:hypothetical protein
MLVADRVWHFDFEGVARATFIRMIAFAVHGANGAPSASAFNGVLWIPMPAHAPNFDGWHRGDVVVGHRHIVESVVGAN